MNCKRCNNTPERGDLFCRKCGEELPAEDTFQCECGAEVRNEDRFCHNCGAMFSAGQCSGCSADLAPNAKYCHECGAKAEETPSETAEQPSYLSEHVQESSDKASNQSAQNRIEVYDDYGNVRPFEEKEEPPKKPNYRMTGDGYFEP